VARPADDGFFMPAEWTPHERCWMEWPCRAELWGDRLEAARDAYAEVATAIARFEPVTMIAQSPHNEEG
jgi:agmatine deiminase